MSEGISGQLVTEGRGALPPAGNGFISVPTAAASSFQVYTAGEGRAHGPVGEYGLAAFLALKLEQFRVVTDGARQ